MSKPIATPSQTDLEDYTAIKKHLPLATPKQVKWIKEMFNMARSLGEQEPVAQKYLYKIWCKCVNLAIEDVFGAKQTEINQLPLFEEIAS